MATLTIKDITFGEGMPKICVPVTGRTQADILSAAKEIRYLPCEVVEWRADFFEDAKRPTRILETLAALRSVLDRQLLLFTFRTAPEGGQAALAPYDYLWLNQKAAESGLPDLIDMEYSCGAERTEAFVRFAHRNGVSVIVSSHDFEKTPLPGEMVTRMIAMQKTKADMVKLAVMPKSRRDVLALLNATDQMASDHAACPIITMSMGKDGLITRLAGETFGSAMTFGCSGNLSAPGQPDVTDLSIALQILHK
jgi:3-dehydroquinate dehydratase-1